MDLTISMDVESNPGPNWTPDKWSLNKKNQILSSPTLRNTNTLGKQHYPNSLCPCTSRRFVYSRQDLLHLNRFPLQQTPDVKPQVSIHCVAKWKYRGTRAGRDVQDMRKRRALNIPVITSCESDNNKRLTSRKYECSQLWTFTLVKTFKEPTAAKIVPRCSIFWEEDINHKLPALNDTFLSTLNAHAPIKLIRIHNLPCPYITTWN